MKLTAKQYAEILVNVVSKADRAVAERFSESFWMLLRENRQEKLFGSIMRYAGRIWNERHDIVDVSATVTDELDSSQREALISHLERALGKKIHLKLRVDHSIRGGIVLQIADSRYDASVAGRLERLARVFQS